MRPLEILQNIIAFIVTIPEKASVSVIKNLWGQEKTMISATLYVCVWLDTIKNGNLLSSNTKILPGISSFDQQQIPKGMDFICTEVCALTQATGTNESSGEAGLLLNAWSDTAPVNVKNADFTVTQGALLFSAPGTDICNFRASTGRDADFRTIVPFRIRGGIDFQININGATASANQGLNFQMRGYLVANSDNASGRA